MDLQKTKYRALLLFPPLILCVIGIIVAFIQVYTHFSFTIHPFIAYTFIVSSIWLLLVMGLILRSDYKKDNR